MADENEGFRLKLEISSDPELLSVVRSAVTQFAIVVGLPEAECRAVTLAVDEALANIMRHAYHNRRGQPISVTCEHGEDRLEFLLRDRGTGVSPAKLRGRSLEDVRPGGLGMHFMNEIMDEVEYARKGEWNDLKLVKYLKKEKAR